MRLVSKTILRIVLAIIVTVAELAWYLLSVWGVVDGVAQKLRASGETGKFVAALIVSPAVHITLIITAIVLFVLVLKELRKHKPPPPKQWYETPENELTAPDTKSLAATIEEKKDVVGDASIPKPKRVVHKNLHDLFRTDFERVTTLHTGYEFSVSNQITGEHKGKVPCELEVLLDLDGRAYFIAFYVPEGALTFEICKAFIDHYPAAVRQLRNEVGFEGGIVGERRTSFKELTFTKRIYIYHETPLMQEQEDKLYALYTKKKLSLILRGKRFEYDANNPRPIPVEAIKQPTVSVERLMELRNDGAAIVNEITTRHVTSPYDTQAKEWSSAVESYLNTQNARTWALEFSNPAMDIYIPLGANETTANTRQLVKWIKTRLVRLNALIERAGH